jgi:hypothetical protein
LHIWEQPNTLPVPGTVAMAGQIWLTLRERKAAINPKFVALARQLVASYPSQQSDPKNSVWIGDPIGEAQTCDDAVFTIALPPANRLGLLRLVADKATAHGLTVYDMQIGMVFLPNGVVLPQEHAAAWALEKQKMDAAPKPKTKAQMLKHLSEYWAPVFGNHGFKPGKKSAEGIGFERGIEHGKQTIAVYVDGSGSEFSCDVHLRVNNEVVTKLFQPYANPNKEVEIVIPMDVLVSQPYGGYPIATPEELQRLTSQIETEALPVLDSLRDVKGMNQVFNIDRPEYLLKEMRFNSNLYFVSLIAARLGGNQQFEVLLEQYCRECEKWVNKFVERMRQLADDLRKIPVPVA